MKKITKNTLAFSTGAIVLCFFATLQKISIGAPLLLKGYIVPFFFGGTASLLLGTWIIKLQEAQHALQKSHEQLESRIRDRTQELNTEVRERKIIEQNLRISEKLLKEAQTIAKIGHWELNLKTGDLDWSDEIYRIFGLQPQGFIATYEALIEKIHPDDREKVNTIFKESVEKQSQYQVEHRILLSDASEKWVLEKGHTEYNDQGEPVRSVGTVQDITEIKLLRGILPICSFCKKIRDNQGDWKQVEDYVAQHSDALFSHSFCPECGKKHYPDIFHKNELKQKNN